MATDVLEMIEWAKNTIAEKDMFGMDEINAGRYGELRARGVLSECKKEIESLRKDREKLVAVLSDLVLEGDHADFCKYVRCINRNCTCMDRTIYNIPAIRERARATLKELGEMEWN